MKDIEKQIIELYVNDRKSGVYISKNLNIKIGNVYCILNKYNVKVRSFEEANTTNTFDKTFFDKIDTEEKAYFLGFLYADGNVHNNVMQICLQSRDEPILQKFKEYLKSTHKIINDRGYKRFAITSTYFTEQLKDKGCMERKTFKITFPSNDIVPTHLIHHFMRGYFDGDGCITYSVYPKYNNSLKWNFNITSNYNFLSKFQEIFAQKCGLEIFPIVREKRLSTDIFTMRYCGSTNHTLLKIIDFLYKDATIFLTRKRNKFIELNNKILERIEYRKIQ